ncbi:MAG: DUF3461 family protein [Arenicellales bacterium]
MSNYPTLTEMGIGAPEDIQRFTLVTHNNEDHLRIVYKRQKGSFLPVSKKFKFGRAQRMVMTDSGTNKSEIVYQISPFLSKATDELREIVKSKHSKTDTKVLISNEITRLEEDTKLRLAYIKKLVSELD